MVPQQFPPDNRVNEIIQTKLRHVLLNDDLHRRNTIVSPVCICEKKEEANHFVSKVFEYMISVLQTRMFYYVNGNLDYVTNVKIITAMQKCMTNSCIFT